jgi:hypothetical protein
MLDILTSPLTGEGQQGEVKLAGTPLRVIDGTYTVEELPRFGQKISSGSLKYADFNPEEQAFSMEGFGDGYGLRRFSDVPSVTTRYGNTFTAEDLVARVVKETSNINGRTGPAVLAPLITVETLPSAAANPVWCGEYTPRSGALAGVTKFVAIAGLKIWYRASNGTWTDTAIALPAVAQKGAIGVFGKLLVIGMGTGAQAVYTDDLATTTQLQMPSTLTTPTGVSYRGIATGGSLTAATAYYYRISAVNTAGETLASTESSFTTLGGGNTQRVVITWNQVKGAATYNVYGRATGAELFMQAVSLNTFIDDGSITPSGALPGSNTTGANVPPYVFGFTSDQAAAYIAGGVNSTDTNLVLSSSDGILYGAPSTSTVCGDTQQPINSLCPGGGQIALVFVGKPNEIGYIDVNGIYRRAVPFEANLSTNGLGITLYLGLGGDAGRGPTIAVFPYDRTLLSYTPSSLTQGTTEDLAPYGREGFRPVNARGVVNAIQGTSRWLYYAITNGTSGNSWIISKNSTTGANSTFLDIGVHTCKTIGYTSLFGSNPLLLFGYGNGIASIVLPLDGDWPLDDANCTYAATGWLDTPDIDNGFPDENKIGVAIHVVCENVVKGHQDISIAVSYDGGALGPTLGTCQTSSSPNQTETIIPMGSTALFKRVGIRVTMTTDDPTKTPVLLALSLRVFLNTQVYRIWTLQAQIPPDEWENSGGASTNALADRAMWWSARKMGYPVAFQDVDNQPFVVRILKLKEQMVESADKMPYVCKMTFQLLELIDGVGTNTYGSLIAIYGNSSTLYG